LEANFKNSVLKKQLPLALLGCSFFIPAWIILSEKMGDLGTSDVDIYGSEGGRSEGSSMDL
jgi:hypothetical protein